MNTAIARQNQWFTQAPKDGYITSPRHTMHEGYGSRSVCVCVCVCVSVCLSATTLAATHLVYTSKMR